MEDATRLVQLLRRFDLPVGTKKAYYLHDGLIHGFYNPRLDDTPLVTSGSSTTLSTDGTKKVPTILVAGSVVYVRNGNLNGLVPVTPGDAQRTRWQERTVISLPTDYSILVDEAIDILAASDGFAYRVLFSGTGADDGWIGTGAARERIVTVECNSGGPVDVEVWGKNESGEPYLIEAFSVSSGATRVYGGVSDYTRVFFSSAVAANVSASLVTRRFAA